MNGELFGVKNFMLENDGLIHDAVIEKWDFLVSPKDGQGYIALCLNALVSDELVMGEDGVMKKRGMNEIVYPTFKANEQNLRNLCRGLDNGDVEYMTFISYLLKRGRKIKVLFGHDSEGIEFFRIYGDKDSGEITHEGA